MAKAKYVIFFDGEKEWKIPIVKSDSELSKYYEEFKKAGKPFIHIKHIGRTVKYKIDFDLNSELTDEAKNKLEEIIRYYTSKSAEYCKKWRNDFEWYSLSSRHGYFMVHTKFKEKAAIEIALILFDESNWKHTL